MSADGTSEFRLRFFGSDDYASYFQMSQAFELLRNFDTFRKSWDLNDIIELSHAITFAEKGFLPRTLNEEDHSEIQSKLADLHRKVGIFFAQINDTNIANQITDLDVQYHTDVLNLMAKYSVFPRCTAAVALAALQAAHVNMHDFLTCKPLVDAYDQELGALLSANPRNAEIVISRSLMDSSRPKIYLPKSFDSKSSNALLTAYLDDSDPNLNYLRLLSTAKLNRDIGLDAKLKLAAKRKLEEKTEEFFNTNPGTPTGVEVQVSRTQETEAEATLEGLVGKYGYSHKWLSENIDYPTILNNFIYLFEFTNDDLILNLPAHAADLGIFERFLASAGVDDYRVGAAFRHTDTASLLQIHMYRGFLGAHGVELEDVIKWFFEKYLGVEFAASRFRFGRPTAESTYLEKSRHLFAEMESVLKQYSLYVENGELDPELLSVTSEQLDYATIPSSIEGKYVYVTSNPEILQIQHLLFSDQSRICWVNQEVHGRSFVDLLINHRLRLEDFLDYQKPLVERLGQLGVIGLTGQVKFVNAAQILTLKRIYTSEATSYYHRTAAERSSIDEMVQKGWLERRSTLLTLAEKSYVNFFLNQKEFSNGPDLRNRYLHGSQIEGEDASTHFNTYLIVLRLLIVFILKINDDLELRDELLQQPVG